MLFIYKIRNLYNLTLFFIILWILLITTQNKLAEYCISPNENQVNCSGISDSIISMPNISNALHQSTSITDNIMIYLANVNNLPFYILREPLNPQSIFNLNSLTIMPYYCILNIKNQINQNCYDDSSYLPIIYLKSDEFSIYLSNSLHISNIIIDGSDLIKRYYDELNGNALKCMTSNELCCISNGINPYPDVICNQTNQIFIINKTKSHGLFNIQDSEEYLEEYDFEVVMTNVKMKNLYFNDSSSFISVTGFNSSITLDNIELDGALFFYGFLEIHDTSRSIDCWNKQTIGMKCQINVNIQNCMFKNINLYNTTKLDVISSSTGYILTIHTINSQNIQISNSNFESMMSSTITNCSKVLIYDNYLSMFKVNDLTSPFRSNLLLQHDLIYKEKWQISAIVIGSLSGNLTLDSNIFDSIIGYSGAALAIDNLDSTANISIIGNRFTNNFGIINGATIRIKAETSTYFDNDLCGSQIKIKNNIFSNNLGCALSYANVLIICSGWLNSNITSFIGYNYPTVNFDLSVSYSDGYKLRMSNQAIIYQVNIENNTFINNYLSLSNGIAIHGYSVVNIAFNTFKDNGVLIELFGKSLISNYTIAGQQPFSNVEFDNLNYLGSSPVYVAAASWLAINNNLFENNSNTFSGDLQFGSQITLRDIIVLKDYIAMYSNIFRNNIGIPPEIRATLNNSILKNGDGITLPLIVFNRYEITNSNFVNWAINPNIGLLLFPTIPYIIFWNCSFQYNSFSFNFNNQTFYNQNIYSYYKNAPEGKISFIKILLFDELYPYNITIYKNELLLVKISDSEFSFNSIKTRGCGLYGSLIINMTLIDITFWNNSIYQDEYDPIIGDNITQDSVSADIPSMINSGLICLNINQNDVNEEQVFDFTSLILEQCFFENNEGQLITKFGTISSSVVILDTKFINNTCNDSALIFANENTQLYIETSSFISNNAAYGCIILYYASYQGLLNNFQQNMGYHASLFFLEKANSIENSSTIIGNIAGLGIQYMYYKGSATVKSAIIYIIKSTYTSLYCNISENIAIAGIFYASSSTLSFEWGIFSNNIYPSSTNNISAILAFITSTSYLICKNCLITNNSGIEGSPRLFMIGLFVNYISSIEFIDSRICQNLLTSKITIMESFSGNTSITTTLIDSNIASSDSIEGSNIIIGNYGYFTILNSIFTNNSNIMTISSGIMTIINTQFNYNNQVNNQKIEIATYFLIKLVIIDSIFNDLSINLNTKVQSGYFLYIVQLVDIYIQNTTFSNMNYQSGAAIQIIGRSSLIISDISFYNILFSNDGAAIMSSNIIGMEIDNTIFDGFKGPSTHISIDSSPQLIFTVNNSTFYNSTNRSAIIISQSARITMRNVVIIANPEFDELFEESNNRGLLITSGVLIINFNEVQIIDSIFKNNKYILGALQLSFSIDSSTVLIFNTIFEKNTALSGGAINILTEENNTNIIIQNCTFHMNIALNQSTSLGFQLNYGKGGAIYYSCDTITDYIFDLTIFDSIFSSNKASIAGGAIYWDYFPPYNNTGLIFLNNSAKYGPDLASYPVYIYPINAVSNMIMPISYDPLLFLDYLLMKFDYVKNKSFEIISGNHPLDNIKFGLFDIYGQIDSNNDEIYIDTIFIQNINDTYSIRANPSQIQAIQGQFSITSFSLDYYPLSNNQITFRASNIKKLPDYYIQGIELFNDSIADSMSTLNNPEYTMKLMFIDCPIGYVFSITTSDTNQYGICTLCPNGKYSLDPQTFQKQNDRRCTICQYDIFQNCTGGYIYLQSGYWRMNATADIILKCSNELYCPGNMNNTNFIIYNCGQNTYGNLCNQCPLGYAKFGSQNNCMNCKQDALYYILLIIMVIIQIIFIVYNVSCTINESYEYNEKNEDVNNEELKSNLMKILTSYTQIISLINIFSVSFPSILTDSFSIISYGSMATDQYFSFECFIVLFSTNLAIRMFNIKLLGISSSPIICSILTYIIWICIFKIKKQKIINNIHFKNKVMTSIVILLYTLQPNLLKYGFILFNCTNLYREDQPIYYLNADYDFQCWDNNHLGWALGLGLSTILLWGIIAPSLIIYHLYTNRYNLDDSSIRLRYAFLYKGYKQERYFWEIIVLFRKFILTTITVFLNLLSSTLQIMAAISILAIFLILQIRVKPFKQSILNILEVKSLFSSLLIAFVLIYFLNNSQRYTIIDIILLLIMGFSYGYFMISWIWYFFQAIKKDILKNKKKIPKILTKIIRYCCFFNNRLNRKIYIENNEFNHLKVDSKNCEAKANSYKDINELNNQDILESKIDESYQLDNTSKIQNQKKDETSRIPITKNTIENSIMNLNDLPIKIPSLSNNLTLKNQTRFSKMNSLMYKIQIKSQLEGVEEVQHQNQSILILRSKEFEEDSKQDSFDKAILMKNSAFDASIVSSSILKKDIQQLKDMNPKNKKKKARELKGLIIHDN